MKEVDIPTLIRKHASGGVLIDANLLLLYVVGKYDPQRIGRFKRTRQFSVEDFQRLGRFLYPFHRRFTTPCILTEVSNLASQLAEPGRSQCLRMLAREIALLDERYKPSSELAADELFADIGLTDCSIRHAANANLLVLTDDYKLANRFLWLDLAAVNFTPLRSW